MFIAQGKDLWREIKELNIIPECWCVRIENAPRNCKNDLKKTKKKPHVFIFVPTKL